MRSGERLVLRLLTSRAQFDSVIPTQLGDCAGSGVFVQSMFPALQDRVGSCQSRPFYDPEGIHLEMTGIWPFVVQQWWAKLEDLSRAWEQRECKQPSVKEQVQSFLPERRELDETEF